MVTLTQVADLSQPLGTDVVATGSGPIDLTGLTFAFGEPIGGSIIPSEAYIFTGVHATIVAYKTIIHGPTSFGSGTGDLLANSSTGDIVGVAFSQYVEVPQGYVSGDPLSDTSTYDNQTFATLGVTPGTYEWTWGSGQNQNFTLQIGPAAVPAPLIGRGLPALLAVGGLLFGAKLVERGKRRSRQFG